MQICKKLEVLTKDTAIGYEEGAKYNQRKTSISDVLKFNGLVSAFYVYIYLAPCFLKMVL
jgi:hypothetical protein